MVNRNYVKGRAFEHAVRKHYESLGYTVIRSAGSKGGVDLIAWRKPCETIHAILNLPHKGDCQLAWIVKVIQCKLYAKKTKKPLRTDVELLRAVQVPSDWQRVLAWRAHGESGFKEEVV